MGWEIWLVIAIVVGLIVRTTISAWRQLRDSEKMLKDIDKSKLKDLGSDGWDGD